MGRRRRSQSSRPATVSIAGSEPSSGGHRWPPKSPSPTGMTSTSRKRKRAASPARTTSTSWKRKRASPARPIGDYKLISLLLETPSGFAIFTMLGHHFNDPDALKNIWAHFGEEYRTKDIVWLKEFKTFKDKSSAINHATGVNEELTGMIMRCCYPSWTLAVGNMEYKRIIEKSLPVRCLFNETVMEAMWGLKNLMHVLVPGEKLKLTKKDRLPMSQGLKWLLDRYGFDVRPEMVCEATIMVACILHDSDIFEKNLSTPLREGGDLLQLVSGIHYKGWDLMKLATALKIICDPRGTTLAEKELFTGDELLILLVDAHKYKNKLAKGTYLEVHKRMMIALDFRARAQKLMVMFHTDAQRTFEAKRAFEAKRRVIKKQLSVKLGLWPKKHLWFGLSPNKSHAATVNG